MLLKLLLHTAQLVYAVMQFFFSDLQTTHSLCSLQYMVRLFTQIWTLTEPICCFTVWFSDCFDGPQLYIYVLYSCHQKTLNHSSLHLRSESAVTISNKVTLAIKEILPSEPRINLKWKNHTSSFAVCGMSVLVTQPPAGNSYIYA